MLYGYLKDTDVDVGCTSKLWCLRPGGREMGTLADGRRQFRRKTV